MVASSFPDGLARGPCPGYWPNLVQEVVFRGRLPRDGVVLAAGTAQSPIAGLPLGEAGLAAAAELPSGAGVRRPSAPPRGADRPDRGGSERHTRAIAL